MAVGMVQGFKRRSKAIFPKLTLNHVFLRVSHANESVMCESGCFLNRGFGVTIGAFERVDDDA